MYILHMLQYQHKIVLSCLPAHKKKYNKLTSRGQIPILSLNHGPGFEVLGRHSLTAGFYLLPSLLSPSGSNTRVSAPRHTVVEDKPGKSQGEEQDAHHITRRSCAARETGEAKVVQLLRQSGQILRKGVFFP